MIQPSTFVHFGDGSLREGIQEQALLNSSLTTAAAADDDDDDEGKRVMKTWVFGQEGR